MFRRKSSRRDSLRGSSSFDLGISTPIAAGRGGVPQGQVLAPSAAAEALRRHSLDQAGAQAIANFPSPGSNRGSSAPGRTYSLTAADNYRQVSGRTSSLTRTSRDSQRTNSLTRVTTTVRQDQSGRTMSLTTTTVRRLGSFEVTTQRETDLRPSNYQRGSSYSQQMKHHQPAHYAESITSFDTELASVREEPEWSSFDGKHQLPQPVRSPRHSRMADNSPILEQPAKSAIRERGSSISSNDSRRHRVSFAGPKRDTRYSYNSYEDEEADEEGSTVEPLTASERALAAASLVRSNSSFQRNSPKRVDPQYTDRKVQVTQNQPRKQNPQASPLNQGRLSMTGFAKSLSQQRSLTNLKEGERRESSGSASLPAAQLKGKTELPKSALKKPGQSLPKAKDDLPKVSPPADDADKPKPESKPEENSNPEPTKLASKTEIEIEVENETENEDNAKTEPVPKAAESEELSNSQGTSAGTKEKLPKPNGKSPEPKEKSPEVNGKLLEPKAKTDRPTRESTPILIAATAAAVMATNPEDVQSADNSFYSTAQSSVASLSSSAVAAAQMVQRTPKIKQSPSNAANLASAAASLSSKRMANSKTTEAEQTKATATKIRTKAMQQISLQNEAQRRVQERLSTPPVVNGSRGGRSASPTPVRSQQSSKSASAMSKNRKALSSSVNPDQETESAEEEADNSEHYYRALLSSFQKSAVDDDLSSLDSGTSFERRPAPSSGISSGSPRVQPGSKPGSTPSSSRGYSLRTPDSKSQSNSYGTQSTQQSQSARKPAPERTLRGRILSQEFRSRIQESDSDDDRPRFLSSKPKALREDQPTRASSHSNKIGFKDLFSLDTDARDVLGGRKFSTATTTTTSTNHKSDSVPGDQKKKKNIFKRLLHIH